MGFHNDGSLLLEYAKILPDANALNKVLQKTIFRCYAVTVLEENIAFCAVYCHYWITLFFLC